MKYLFQVFQRWGQEERRKYEEEVKEVKREGKMLWKVKIPLVGQKELVFWVWALCRLVE